MAYSNPEHGARRAVAEVIGVSIEEVELSPVGDGTFAIVRPLGANPDPAEVAAWLPPPPPDPEPVTDVDTSTSNFIAAEEYAAKFLNRLKGEVIVYLKTLMSEAKAVAAGVAFVAPRAVDPNGVGTEYDYFVKAGGHPSAASALYTRIQEVKGHFAWFDEQVDAIFTAALTQS